MGISCYGKSTIFPWIRNGFPTRPKRRCRVPPNRQPPVLFGFQLSGQRGIVVFLLLGDDFEPPSRAESEGGTKPKPAMDGGV